MDLSMFTAFFQRLEVQIGVAVVLFLIIAWLVFRRVRINGLKNKMQAMETRYNGVKSIPLPFKLNKAVALARVNGDILAMVNDFKNSFEQIQENLKSIANVLAETEDAIIVNKSKQAKLNLSDLGQMLTQIEKQVDSLNAQLDGILEEENQQRSHITELKDAFRQIKSDITARSVQMSISMANLDVRTTEIEKAFTTFEEWMYASEFGKAKEKMDEIQTGIGELRILVDKLPDLIGLAKGVIPKQIEEISLLYTRLKNNNVYIAHLDVVKNVELISETTAEDLSNLTRCVIKDVDSHLHDNQKRLEQLHGQLLKEENAESEVENALAAVVKEVNGAHDVYEQLKLNMAKDSGRFGWEELNILLKEREKDLKKLSDLNKRLAKMRGEHTVPATTLILSIREAQQEVTNTRNDLNHAFERLNSAKTDEERAKKQLLKLHLIMNEIQVKIRKYRLPVISETYEEDLRKSYQYINSIQKLLDESPIDIRLLNATVNDGIDFIYRLYNNVNNLVGTVEMIENSIVYGNKFRSRNAELDTQLTRAELLFKNGDYTQAIKVVISAIEAVEPSRYETLIRENAKSARA